MIEQASLSDFERRAGERARHRALILQILHDYPSGLTSNEVVLEESKRFGYIFLTDNRLRELRGLGFVESVKAENDVLKWKLKP